MENHKKSMEAQPNPPIQAPSARATRSKSVNMLDLTESKLNEESHNLDSERNEQTYLLVGKKRARSSTKAGKMHEVEYNVENDDSRASANNDTFGSLEVKSERTQQVGRRNAKRAAKEKPQPAKTEDPDKMFKIRAPDRPRRCRWCARLIVGNWGHHWRTAHNVFNKAWMLELGIDDEAYLPYVVETEEMSKNTLHWTKEPYYYQSEYYRLSYEDWAPNTGVGPYHVDMGYVHVHWML